MNRTARLSLFERLIKAAVSQESVPVVDSKPPGTCWTWTGSRDAKGYGLVKVDGRCRRVHRVAYELATGRKLGRLTLDHTCRNTSCWRPSHGQPMTRSKNTAKGNRDNPRVPPQLRSKYDGVLGGTRVLPDERRESFRCDFGTCDYAASANGFHLCVNCGHQRGQP